MTMVRVFNRRGELVGPVESPRVVKSDAEWRAQLTPEQFQIARGKGTERAFCGTLLDNKREGIYSCICCGLPLFTSSSKFHSGTGWPSFFQPVADESVTTHDDRSYGMHRTEILCARATLLRELRLAPFHRYHGDQRARRPGSPDGLTFLRQHPRR